MLVIFAVLFGLLHEAFGEYKFHFYKMFIQY